MNNTVPEVAVIIPAYNAAKYLPEALQSVLNQSLVPREIIVVDDGSIDDTPMVARQFSSQVTFVRQANTGQGGARQHGFEKSMADFLMFLDADDSLHPQALEKLSAALLEQPAAPMAFCAAQLWSPAENDHLQADSLGKLAGKNIWAEILKGNRIRTPGCVLIRRSALLRAGGWDVDPRLCGHEDWELWVRLAEKGDFVCLPEPLIKYRQHPNGFSKNRLQMRRSLFVMFQKQLARWRTNPVRRQTVLAAEWRSCRYNAKEMLRDARRALTRGKAWLALCIMAEMIRLMAKPLRNRLFVFCRSSR